MGARHRDCEVGWVLEKEAGCKGRPCCVCEKIAFHVEMREVVAAWRKGAGVSRVLVRARLVMKEAASSLQRPPTSMPNTTRRHLQS